METINLITGFLACCFDGTIMLWFVGKILGEKREIRWWNILPFFLLLFGNGFFMGNQLILQAILIPVILIVYERIYLKGSFWQQLLIAVICIVIITLINGLVIQIASVFVKGDIAESIVAQDILWVQMTLLDKVALFIGYFTVIKVFRIEQGMKLGEEIITVMLFLTIFVNGLVSVMIIEDGYHSRQESIGLLVVNILQIGVAITVYYIMRNLGKQRKLRAENAILSTQIHEQEHRLRQTEELYQATRKMRHDMKRYFTTYLELLEAGKTELVIEDLQQTLQSRLPAKQVVYTSNQVINAVINDKMRFCQEKEIFFDIQITDDIPGDSGMDDAIILSNLLDNAIEAEERIEEISKRKITLRVFCYKGMLNLIVRNYIEKSVLKENPFLRTTKKNKFYHGVGIGSVREMVKGQNGEVDFAEEESFFVVHILLPKKSVEESV